MGKFIFSIEIVQHHFGYIMPTIQLEMYLFLLMANILQQVLMIKKYTCFIGIAVHLFGLMMLDSRLAQFQCLQMVDI